MENRSINLGQSGILSTVDMPQSILECLDRVPPCICRLLARTGRGRKSLSNAQIAVLASISKNTVHRLSNRTSWSGFTIDVIMRFSKACGVDLLKPKRQMDYLRRGQFLHVYGSKGHQRQLYSKIFERASADRNARRGGA